MADGEYTAKSAYGIQFQGSFSKLRILSIWKAKAEPKYKFFKWTLLHKKILTANNLIKRNWSNDLICKLCNIDPETPTHLCKDCVFLKGSLVSFKTMAWIIITGHGADGGIHSQLIVKMPRKN